MGKVFEYGKDALDLAAIRRVEKPMSASLNAVWVFYIGGMGEEDTMTMRFVEGSATYEAWKVYINSQEAPNDGARRE